MGGEAALVEESVQPARANTSEAAAPSRPVPEEKPSLFVLLCFLSFFAYCFVAWYVTSRVERVDLPDLTRLEADTNTAVSHTPSRTLDELLLLRYVTSDIHAPFCLSVVVCSVVDSVASHSTHPHRSLPLALPRTTGASHVPRG